MLYGKLKVSSQEKSSAVYFPMPPKTYLSFDLEQKKRKEKKKLATVSIKRTKGDGGRSTAGGGRWVVDQGCGVCGDLYRGCAASDINRQGKRGSELFICAQGAGQLGWVPSLNESTHHFISRCSASCWPPQTS